MKVNWSELGVFISVCGSVLVSLCFAIQKSRCDKIKCCCMEIHRTPPPITNNKEPNSPLPTLNP